MEILFKVRTADPIGNQYRDGDIVRLADDGVLITPAEIVAWFTSGTIPAEWSSIPAWNQRAIKNQLLRTKWLTTHTLAEIVAAAEWKCNAATEEEKLAMAGRLKDNALEDRTAYLADGVDSNWGRETLKAAGVVRIDAITPRHIRELIDEDRSESHVPLTLGKRRWRVNYRAYLSAEVIASLEDDTVWTAPQRSVSLPLAALVDDPRNV